MTDTTTGTEPEQPAPRDIAALDTLRRGIARTPVLRAGLIWSVLFGLAEAAGRLVIPILVQQTIDHGFSDGLDRSYVNRAVAIAIGVILVVGVSGLIAKFRMIRAAEQSLYDLRVQAFRRAHELSLTDLNDQRRGELVSRVTSDVDTIARFLDWGALAWIVQGTLLIGVVAVMAIYSWQLMLIAALCYALMLPILAWLQRRQVAAYALRRTRVGQVLGLTGEVVGGAETVRVYGVTERITERLDDALTGEYRAALGTTRYFSVLFTVGDLFSAFALIVVTGSVLQWGLGWGLDLGEVIAVLLLLQLAQSPIAELSEVLDQTQTALAGWDKVLSLLDQEPTVTEPIDGRTLPSGPVEIVVDDVWFSYQEGPPVLKGVSVTIPAGTSVAVVGETGSGKTTFARLLVRLTDPSSGEIRLNGVALPEVSPDARHAAVRMVPQDGFLFDTTVKTNISYGRHDATEADIDATIRSVGLEPWIAGLPDGLDTPVGERGEQLSVGERQLVAAARAALADPGLLVMDEATSSVDPETEQMLGVAFDRLAAGRTTVAIAHRLSTAERADLILVFDAGQLVEQGTHAELVAAGGRYAALHTSWIRTARSHV
ncbi:MAG: ABC transporter ATP-binding protein [Acidimicrobiales bacterium]